MESNDIVVLDIERIRVIVVHIRNSIIDYVIKIKVY